MRKIAFLFAVISAQLSALFFVRIRNAKGLILVAPKMLVGALAPLLALFGGLGVGLGFLFRAPFAMWAGLFGFITSVRYIGQVVDTRGDFESAFGQDWQERISPPLKPALLNGRWGLQRTPQPEARLEQNIPFWTISAAGDVSGSERQLVCDIWQPPVNIRPSKIAIIYLHGSGWHFMDKDQGTRPMFRQLAAQGHVIMDVAYRLCPETQWRGMQEDAKRAVAWMKANAAKYGVDPGRVVLAGASAGGHLALLAAYTARQKDLRPADTGSADLSVCGVISWYGPTDMRVYYDYAGEKFNSIVQEGKTETTDEINEWVYSHMGIDMKPMTAWQPGMSVQENMMRNLFGGTPQECPEEYRLASPVTHVGRHCPPTLLLQGTDDFVVSAEAVGQLADELRQAGVPVVHVEYPQTDHAFDLILPQISPPAQAALYETERFLAVLASTPPENGRSSAPTAPVMKRVRNHQGERVAVG
jgi:acetyl esterase/lipase